jgi:hypothetical protein
MHKLNQREIARRKHTKKAKVIQLPVQGLGLQKHMNDGQKIAAVKQAIGAKQATKLQSFFNLLDHEPEKLVGIGVVGLQKLVNALNKYSQNRNYSRIAYCCTQARAKERSFIEIRALIGGPDSYYMAISLTDINLVDAHISVNELNMCIRDKTGAPTIKTRKYALHDFYGPLIEE